MKTLVAYYSLEGNTKFVAEKIAAKLQADLLFIEPEKAYPTGKVTKYLFGGKSATMGESPKLKPLAKNPADYDLVIVGTPVWAGTMTPPVKSFLEQNSLKGKHVAFFINTASNKSGRCFEELERLAAGSAVAGKLWLIDPLTRGKPENQQKLDKFCENLSF